jgi:hypothetical protein
MIPITEKAVDLLIDAGFTDCSVYNHGKQINVSDKNGIIQTYYPTTGTVLLRQNNSRYNNKTKSLYNKTIEEFIQLLNNPTLAKMLKNEREED